MARLVGINDVSYLLETGLGVRLPVIIVVAQSVLGRLHPSRGLPCKLASRLQGVLRYCLEHFIYYFKLKIK